MLVIAVDRRSARFFGIPCYLDAHKCFKSGLNNWDQDAGRACRGRSEHYNYDNYLRSLPDSRLRDFVDHPSMDHRFLTNFRPSARLEIRANNVCIGSKAAKRPDPESGPKVFPTRKPHQAEI